MIEQGIIRLKETQFRERNDYKIYYFIVYEYPNNSIFSENENLNIGETLQPNHTERHIMFEIKENDISH